MDEKRAISGLAALSNSTRLRMFRALVAAGVQGMPAGEVGRRVDAAPSRASFHLSALSRAGLVSSRRRAKEVTYFADFKGVGALMGYLLSECCQDNPTVRSCCGLDAAD